ncbi:MAG: GAF domain-containing protein, partial [Methanobacteriota archaeon]
LINNGEPSSLVDAVNFTLGKGGTLHCAKKQVPVLIRSQYQQNQFSVSSFLAYPIIFRGKTLGVITLGKYQQHFFTKKHVLYVKIFSIYLQNVLIFLEAIADNKQGK